MPYGLSDTDILEMLHPENSGATYYEIAEQSPHDIGREQGRYAVDRLKNQGYDIVEEQDPSNPKKKRFYYDGDISTHGEQEENSDETTIQDDEQPLNHTEKKRVTTTAKQTMSKKANERLVELEDLVKPVAQELGPQRWNQSPEVTQGGRDVVIHETDIHFGDKVKNDRGQLIYNSEIAEQRVRNRFHKIMGKVEEKREKGAKIENAHLLLGGDLLTNEAIYETQPFHIDETVDQQFQRAVSTYMDVLQTLSNNFNQVQVVCTGGNHGEFRVKGSSEKANGDDLVYDMLEIYSHKLDMDNVQFVKSDRTDRVIFDFRGHTGYLTHGENRSFHIGTPSPESDWLSFKDQHNFDAAFRGHYHDWRIEQVNGAPVCMTPSQKPPGDFEDKQGAYGTPHNVVYFASDNRPIAEVETFQVEP